MLKTAPINTRGIWLPLIVLCMAQFLASADNVTLSIATHALMHDLGASMAQVSAANTMYPLIAGTFMIAGGMLGGVLGWRRTFRIGCAIYLLGELCATLAPSISFFIWAARILAGIGGSFMIPSVFGLITGLYQGRDRAMAFGALGAASGVSFALGPIICGMLLDTLGWRWAFSVMGGLLVIILLLSALIDEPAKSNQPLHFDFPAFILSTIGLFLVIFGILQISNWGLFAPFNPPFTLFGLSPALFLVLAGILVLIIMLRWEKTHEARTGSALIPHAFLHTPQVRAGLYLTAYIFFAYSSGIFVVVSFAQVVSGLTAIQTGLLIVPFAICLAGCSLGLPLFIHQRNARRQCRVGLILGIIGAAVTAAGIGVHSFNRSLIIVGLCFIGSSMGVIAANAPYLVTSALPEKEARQSGGIQSAARDIGQALGVALVSTVMLTTLTFSMKHRIADITVTPQTRITIQNMTVFPYLSDQGFSNLLVQSGATKQDLPTITKLYQHSRARVSQAGLLATALMTLLFLLGTRGILQPDGKK